MSTTVAELISEAKEAADLTNVTDYVTDAQWVKWLNAGVVELHRFITNKFKATYFREYDFTLAEGESRLTLPSDFKRLRGLDIYPDTPRRRTVRPFNFSDRNRGVGGTPADFTIYCQDRRYNVLGSRLLKVKADGRPDAPGDYRLYYVPRPTLLSVAIDVEFAIDDSDNPAVPPAGFLDGDGSWALLNAAFTDTIPVDGTVDLVLDFDAPNESFSASYPIVDIGLVSEGFGLPTAGVSNLVSTAGFTGPAAGTGSYSYHPIGTANALDDELEPYAEYVWLCAAIKSLAKEESSMQAKLLIDQRNLIREDLTEALEPDQGGPKTVIDTDEDW